MDLFEEFGLDKKIQPMAIMAGYYVLVEVEYDHDTHSNNMSSLKPLVISSTSLPLKEMIIHAQQNDENAVISYHMDHKASITEHFKIELVSTNLMWILASVFRNLQTNSTYALAFGMPSKYQSQYWGKLAPLDDYDEPKVALLLPQANEWIEDAKTLIHFMNDYFQTYNQIVLNTKEHFAAFLTRLVTNISTDQEPLKYGMGWARIKFMHKHHIGV